jgi:hypothetical protein
MGAGREVPSPPVDPDRAVRPLVLVLVLVLVRPRGAARGAGPRENPAKLGPPATDRGVGPALGAA